MVWPMSAKRPKQEQQHDRLGTPEQVAEEHNAVAGEAGDMAMHPDVRLQPRGPPRWIEPQRKGAKRVSGVAEHRWRAGDRLFRMEKGPCRMAQLVVVPLMPTCRAVDKEGIVQPRGVAGGQVSQLTGDGGHIGARGCGEQHGRERSARQQACSGPPASEKRP